MQSTGWWADPFDDPTWRLQFQSLAHARILLEAWHITGRHAYLSKAQDIILSWIRFARKWPFGGGLMWNDQAVADRAVVFSLFWTAYARSPAYDHDTAAEVLRSVARHVGFMTNSRHFTFLTSHGVLQNVALLHVASTFPTLAARANAVDTAVRRLTLQYRLLATPEGVWTEHSPGYQLLAVKLLRSASGYLTILGRHPPEEWAGIRARLDYGLVQMARPDGSLPPLGDTVESPRHGHDWPPDLLAAVRGKERASEFLAPCAGYAVLWDNRPSSTRQVIMTVSNFRGHSHKHADELSTYLFADGITWLTGPGYWPYSAPGRHYATGWTGANAPSIDGEPQESDRESMLVAHADAGWGEFVEMKRSGPGRFAARRQVAWVRPDWLIVADQIRSDGHNVVLRWLLSPDVVVEPSTSNEYIVHPQRATSVARLRVWILGATPPMVTVARGVQRPFKGWAYTRDEVRPAPTIEIKPRRGDEFVVSVLRIDSTRGLNTSTAVPRLVRAGSDWSVLVPGSFELSSSFGTSSPDVRLKLKGSSAAEHGSVQPVVCQHQVKRAYETVRTGLEAEYRAPGESVPLKRYRDVTLLVIAAWLLQELMLLPIKRWSGRLVVAARVSSCIALLFAAAFLISRWWGTYVI